MNTLRLWARVCIGLVAVGLTVSTQTSVASPTGAPGEDLPTSPAKGPFSQWKTMHASSYAGTVDSALGQCYRSVFSADWIDSDRCQRFGEMLRTRQCQVVWVKDGHRLDLLNGRVNGNPAQESQVWKNQEKHTGRLDRALWCDLGDGVHAYWFTGVKGQSCNNVGFVNKPHRKPLAKRKPKSHGFSAGHRVQHTGVVNSSRVQQVPEVYLNCPTLYVPSATIVIPDGSGHQSTGSSMVYW